MLKQLLDVNFWFSQPAFILTTGDHYFFLKFIVSTGLGFALMLVARFMKDAVIAKLLRRFMYLELTIGLSGLVWYALRFENTPIFSLRYWAGLILLSCLIWLVFILKYWIFQFRKDRVEFQRQQLKNKYLPNQK